MKSELFGQFIDSWFGICATLLTFTSIYGLFVTISRLFFSPISKFPGPKIAAITGWYEFYYDVWKPGMYIYEIEKMHQQYGPIVRINPEELSIDDPDFYDDLYVLGSVRKTNKFQKFCQGTGLDGTTLLTQEHDLHRRRRRVLDPFFSRTAVRKMDPIIADLVAKFETRLLAANSQVIRFDHALFCLSGDIIRALTLSCDEIDYLMDDPGWSQAWFDLFSLVVKSAPLMTALPWLIFFALNIPTGFLFWLFPRGKAFADFKEVARQHILKAKNEKGQPDEKAHSIFREIVDLNMPESEKDTERLIKEAQSFFGAATVAVGRTLECIAYYVLADPHMRERLGIELRDVMDGWPSTKPSSAQLQTLPYLEGVVNEGLRLSYGSMHRMPRISPDIPIRYKDWVIPPNVPVGMSTYFNHTNSEIFPSPFAFKPERWLEAKNLSQMKKALTPFTRGSRVCVGKNLAIAEVYMATAALFRPAGVHMSLYDTDESDVKSVHDFMIPMPKLDSNGLRVVVT